MKLNLSSHPWPLFATFCVCALLLWFGRIGLRAQVGPFNMYENNQGIEANIVEFSGVPNVIQYTIRRPDGTLIRVYVAKEGNAMCRLHEYVAGSWESK